MTAARHSATPARTRRQPAGRGTRIGQVRLPNSMTVERDSLLPGSIDQVASHRSTNPQSFVWLDRWNYYSRIGNVIGTFNTNGYREKVPRAYASR